jgi:hypothetical protein
MTMPCRSCAPLSLRTRFALKPFENPLLPRQRTRKEISQDISR